MSIFILQILVPIIYQLQLYIIIIDIALTFTNNYSNSEAFGTSQLSKFESSLCGTGCKMLVKIGLQVYSAEARVC